MSELEQFCILARTQKGRACAALIQQVLNHRKIYVFGELLAQPAVQSLKDSEFSKAYNSLELFAYGTYKDYEGNKELYLELSEVQTLKLQHLSLVTLAARDRVIPYHLMQKEFGIDSTRALEDLIIDAMYSGLLTGTLDQKNGLLRVKSVMARDVKVTEIDALIETLITWKQSIGQLSEAVQQSSWYMSDQRQQAQEEKKSAQETYDSRKKDIKAAFDSGESVDDVLAMLGEGSGEGGHISGRTRPSSNQGQRSGVGKHPRRGTGAGGAAGSIFSGFGRR
uniref:PCI domain-containing protein n=1 Tax=Spumella elongata TaxID=89044 RepID=A0A7S3GVI1_9STRA|mmetsp:Transcript_2180/g.3650  ORF Transcript_2180/g.3650 Transcript_2180/m.3650 type:complete len:280 (+) Transcript_2180:27-866(+)|eukprot:CAMPEP_0184979448 /NCGR_PEP_ID=MMETSP1098-20130426/9740_1 /TAXON_ID=89044 /ORGANISM="Spumella elongata, Strain CCAP 955/1" /LENGTH=279 /DNA_ID=CAMNT_0027502767 /DNA_START=27 /DNA_END=866 /DNA_ORIENTATION=-